jgi:hypothetical protein
MTTHSLRARLLTPLLLLLATGAAAQVAVSADPPPHPNGNGPPTLFRMPGFFEIEMPRTERRGEVTFDFQPHFRDLIDQPYLRVPLEFRWGVNDHFELNFTGDSYLALGLRHGNPGNGFSALHFGAKYAWHEWLKPVWETSVGFNASFPVSRPPIELTDGHNHVSPFITLGRKIDGIKGLAGFLNLSVDLMSKSSTPGNFGRNEPHGKSMTVRPGLIYHRGPWHYTLEVAGTTTRVIGGGDHDFLVVRPGVLWDLPRRLFFLSTNGRWVAGFNVTATFGPDGNQFSTGGRLRGEVNLTRLFRRGPSRPAPNPPDPQPWY